MSGAGAGAGGTWRTAWRASAERRRSRFRARPKDHANAPARQNSERQVHSERVPDHVIAARDARLALSPRDLTAAFCGDPLPGYSALDRARTREERKLNAACATALAPEAP